MMADFVTPRHSAVMERLRRRIELFRQHHNSCESRYESATLERLELERQQTFALHQRCLQAKAKRSSKHRQPQAGGDQAGSRAPGGGGGGGGGGSGGGGGGVELGESGGTAAEQSRNSTLIALQETVKRKLESAGSPLGRDQVNGFGDGFPPNKKACLDNGRANGSPLDSKLGISDSLNSNGTHGPSGEPADGVGREPCSDFRRKEMKQEPDDILPIMPPAGGGGGNNSLFPDLNLNEQEWTELMEELNCSVAYEDIQDILNDGFEEDRKDSLAPAPGGAGTGGGGAGGGGGPGSSQGLLPPDLVNVKTEFSPSSVAFEQDSRTGSPHVRSSSSGPPPPRPTSSPVASSTSASSPALPPSQQPAPPPPRQLHPPGPPVPKDLSPAQQLQQLAAQQQRAQQHLHGQMQHKQPQQPGAKFHSQGPHAHPPPWPQMANASQSPLGAAFGMDKPTSPSLYSQDFNPNAQKQLLMPGPPNKGPPKAGPGGYIPAGHPGMMGHPASGPPLGHPPAPGAQATAAMLNYNNTKPLSHFEAGPGPPRLPNTQSQNKAALLTLLRQQQQIKQKNSMNFRQHIPHSQDQNYPAPPHGPGPASAMAPAPGSNAMTAQPGANAMAANHGNAAYLSSQAAVAAALKQQQQQQQQQQHQQQILEQQKQQYMQRQQLMAEQEKQRQQDQQLQRHLTRPPPQYQDQPGQPANQSPFPQPPGNQFTASSQPIGGVGSMGGPAPGSQRMFPQNQGMMGMTGGVAPPPTGSQGDLGLSSCGGGVAGVDVQQVLYNNMNLHPSHPNHPSHPPQQPGLQRQPLGAMSAAYRQNLLAQQHLKSQPNAAMLKQQQQQLAAAAARMPVSMQNSMAPSMPGGGGGMQGAQSAAAWRQQQLANQPPSSNAGLPPNAFSNALPNAFRMQQQQQQARLPKMAPGAAPFGTNNPGGVGGRPMGVLNAAAQHQMMQTNMAAAQQRAPPNPQSLGPPMAAQQQTQQQANQNQAVLPDLAAFGPGGRQALQCNQGYQVSRTAGQQQTQQVSFGYNVASGSFAGESELVDSLLKGQSTQEWMADLDELLAGHH